MNDQVLSRPQSEGLGGLAPVSFAPAASAVRRRLSRKRAALLAAALFGTVGLGWYGEDWWKFGRFIESTDDAYVGGDVTVIAPKVSGFIERLAVTDNQQVHAGDLLVRLDDRDERAALAKARAEVSRQRATLANIAARRNFQLAEIAEAQAALESTAARIELTRSDVARYGALSHDQFASQQRFQQADAASHEAAAEDLKAHAALEAARRQLDIFDTERLQTEAALQSALADQDSAQLNLGYTELRAPTDGVVGNRSARLGAFAPVDAQLLSIVPAHGLWVDANFKEDQLAHMRPGQPVSIRADVLPGQPITGHLESLAPATGAQFSVLPAENATGNFTKIVQRVPVRVRLDGTARDLGLLRPGLSVTASVDERETAR